MKKRVITTLIVGATLASAIALKPASCHWHYNGLTDLQDPSCTPGEVDPHLTQAIICSPTFRTSTVRNQTTSEAQKASTYNAYGVPHPKNNIGPSQVCELDHLISLENGGADTIKNIFPQCSATYSGWQGLGFRDKDKIENRVHAEICSGRITLEEGQKCLATDWTKCP